MPSHREKRWRMYARGLMTRARRHPIRFCFSFAFVLALYALNGACCLMAALGEILIARLRR